MVILLKHPHILLLENAKKNGGGYLITSTEYKKNSVLLIFSRLCILTYVQIVQVSIFVKFVNIKHSMHCIAK